jgi:hypothetical protein
MNSEGTKTRIAFIGQANYFDFVALSVATPSIETKFVDFKSGGDVAALLFDVDAIDPDVIIVFGPQNLPHATLADSNAVRIGWFTEPIAKVSSLVEFEQIQRDESIKSLAQTELERRLLNASSLDASQFDRLISHDPLQAPTLELFGPIWRSVPLPVDDRFFREPQSMRSNPVIGFIGSSTPYREEFLTILKHNYDLRHFAHGLFGDRLLDQLIDFDIAINLHNLDISSFENRVSLHLAQGHLLLSQPLSPSHGLEADRDFIEFRNPEELANLVTEIRHYPHAHELTRTRGRMKAEYFRASVVYEKIVRDLKAEGAL